MADLALIGQRHSIERRLCATCGGSLANLTAARESAFLLRREIVNMDKDALVDAFVRKVNDAVRQDEYLDAGGDACPPSVRVGDPDEYGDYHWQIKRCDLIDWIEDLEAKLSVRFPPSFRSLVTRYIFPAIQLESMALCANTPEGTPDELRNWATNREMWDLLLDTGYVPFGRGEIDANIDPICFDTNHALSDGEFPIVRFYHEELWIDKRVRVDEFVAPSFLDFLKKELESPNK